MSFIKTTQGSVALWRGNPNCAAGQAFVRDWLRDNTPVYPVAWVPANTRLQGNLGECIAFICARIDRPDLNRCVAANAYQALDGISRPDIDLLWIGIAANPVDDFVIHQEVKTTTVLTLGYSSELLTDYRKSFGDNPRLTLNTHLQAVKSKAQYEWNAPDLIPRIDALQADTPANARRLTIVPTLIHDVQSVDPVPKLLAIEAALKAEGWRAVQPWSIAFDGLANHLESMAEDKE